MSQVGVERDDVRTEQRARPRENVEDRASPHCSITCQDSNDPYAKDSGFELQLSHNSRLSNVVVHKTVLFNSLPTSKLTQTKKL